MAGPNNSSNDSGNGRNASFIFGRDVKDRIIAALLAVILGSTGAAGYLNLNPPRPDPYTGTMAKEDQVEMRKWVQTEIDRINVKLSIVDRRLELIYEMRQDIAVMREKVERLDRKLNGN